MHSVSGSETFCFETDLNAAIVCGTRRAELFDANYGLRWQDGAEWTRAPEDVLCFTTREHFYGIVPQFERDLKLDRKAAKERMAQAEAAGDKLRCEAGAAVAEASSVGAPSESAATAATGGSDAPPSAPSDVARMDGARRMRDSAAATDGDTVAAPAPLSSAATSAKPDRAGIVRCRIRLDGRAGWP
jgi:hypothetical protein